MKLSLLLIACAITAYSFSMETTITLPNKEALEAQLHKECLWDFLKIDLCSRLSGQTVTASEVTAHIDASIEAYRKISPTRVLLLDMQRKQVVDAFLEYFPKVKGE
jgi:hypothetical protein